MSGAGAFSGGAGFTIFGIGTFKLAVVSGDVCTATPACGSVTILMMLGDVTMVGGSVTLVVANVVTFEGEKGAAAGVTLAGEKLRREITGLGQTVTLSGDVTNSAQAGVAECVGLLTMTTSSDADDSDPVGDGGSEHDVDVDRDGEHGSILKSHEPSEDSGEPIPGVKVYIFKKCSKNCHFKTK
jgi:hypothetical protein